MKLDKTTRTAFMESVKGNNVSYNEQEWLHKPDCEICQAP